MILQLICFLKGIYRSIPQYLNLDYTISGHDFVDIEEHDNCHVVISKCETCDKVDISWAEGTMKYRK